MNSVQILGNLARDPEVRYTKTGRAVATFTVAATTPMLTLQQMKRKNKLLSSTALHGVNLVKRQAIFVKAVVAL